MNSTWQILLGAALIWGNSAPAATFEGVTEFKSYTILGELDVTCFTQHGPDFRHYMCHDEILDPFEYADFWADTGSDFHDVELEARWPNGQVVTKKAGYDGAKGKSKSQFNLWVQSLLQTPLLSPGTNQVQYRLLDSKGVSQKTGVLTVQVDLGGERDCPPSHESGDSSYDCQFSDRVCGRYFARHSWCR